MLFVFHNVLKIHHDIKLLFCASYKVLHIIKASRKVLIVIYNIVQLLSCRLKYSTSPAEDKELEECFALCSEMAEDVTVEIQKTPVTEFCYHDNSENSRTVLDVVKESRLDLRSVAPSRSPDSGVKVDYKDETTTLNNIQERSRSNKSLLDNFSMKNSGKVAPLSSSAAPTSPSSTIHKSAWERAQDAYEAEAKKNKARRKEVKIDEADILRNETWFHQRSIKHVFKTKQFKNPKLEALYQRYFFKLNQYNLTILMSVFCILAILLIIFYYVSGATLPVRGTCLGVIILIFLGLEVLCNRSTFDRRQSVFVCYVIVVILCGFIAIVTADTDPRSASDSVWCAVLFVYMTYTMLPVRMRVAVLSANLITVLHIIITVSRNYQDSYMWKEVING